MAASDTVFGDEIGEVGDAAAIAPLVVVPGH
jgi:hypothetical protein